MSVMDNEKTLFESGQAPTVKHVKTGDKIKVRDDEGGLVTWRVRQVYPFFVYATSGSRHKCFNYGTLVQLGLKNGFAEKCLEPEGRRNAGR